MLLAFTNLIRWPLVGFMVGSVTGDPTAWHRDRQVVRLCSLLTWLLVLPCVVRVVVQAPVWLAGSSGALPADTAVADPGHPQDRPRLAAPARRAGLDGLGAGTQPHPGRAGR